MRRCQAHASGGRSRSRVAGAMRRSRFRSRCDAHARHAVGDWLARSGQQRAGNDAESQHTVLTAAVKLAPSIQYPASQHQTPAIVVFRCMLSSFATARQSDAGCRMFDESARSRHCSIRSATDSSPIATSPHFDIRILHCHHASGPHEKSGAVPKLDQTLTGPTADLCAIRIRHGACWTGGKMLRSC